MPILNESGANLTQPEGMTGNHSGAVVGVQAALPHRIGVSRCARNTVSHEH